MQHTAAALKTDNTRNILVMNTNLEIFIVTYNRAAFLKNTLEYLSNSVLKNYKITVLNNYSTDTTEEVCNEYQSRLSNLILITHCTNIGACANIIRGFEISKSLYTWVLCDDDNFNLDSIEDLLEVLEKGEVDLIHVGAHPDNNWIYGGQSRSARTLLSSGYHYFKYGSFIPCNIFKTKRFKETISSAYNNIANGYPQQPYLIDIYFSDSPIYISKKQLVTAKTYGQFYDKARWLVWWINSCTLLKNMHDVRLAFFDHFDEGEIESLYSSLKDGLLLNQAYKKDISGFVDNYFLKEEKKRLQMKINLKSPFKSLSYYKLSNVKKLLQRFT